MASDFMADGVFIGRGERVLRGNRHKPPATSVPNARGAWRAYFVGGWIGRSLAITLLLTIPVPLVSADLLLAGAAQSVITPELSAHTVYLAGFGYKRVATGVHDELYARCLALEISKQMLVLCSSDLIGLFYEDVLTIRRVFHEMAPKGSVLIVASTHTHAGPDTLGLYGPKPLATGIDPTYLDWIDHRIATTAADAVRAMQPARLELARDDHPLLALLQDVDRPPIVKDPFLYVMRLSRRSTGQTIATVVNWSDHPEVLSRKNTQITADYPHWTRDYLEKKLGGMTLFFPGSIGKVSPLGDQVALVDPQTGQVAMDGSWRKAELLGTEIGRLAERALKNAKQVNVDSLPIRSNTFFVPMYNRNFRAAEAAGVFAGRKPFYTTGKLDPAAEIGDLPELGRAKYATGHDIQTEVDYVEFRSNGVPVAEIVTIPGEIYPELVNGGVTKYRGADYAEAPVEPVLRKLLNTKYQFILGLGNDEIGYLIPKAEWDEKPPWLNNASKPWYGEVNSVGPDAAACVLRTLAALISRR